MFWQNATGGRVSRTVTTALQELVFPLLSVAVRTMMVEGRSAQVKTLVFVLIEEIPQASVVPLFTKNGITLTLPELLRITVAFLHVVTGRTVSRTVTFAEQDALRPKISVATNVEILAPVFKQVKLFGVTEVVEIPQLSVMELDNVFPLINLFPAKFR